MAHPRWSPAERAMLVCKTESYVSRSPGMADVARDVLGHHLMLADAMLNENHTCEGNPDMCHVSVFLASVFAGRPSEHATSCHVWSKHAIHMIFRYVPC